MHSGVHFAKITKMYILFKSLGYIKVMNFSFAFLETMAGSVDRVFSLMNTVDSLKGIILTKYNMKKFYAYVIGNEDFLQRIGSSEKYSV